LGILRAAERAAQMTTTTQTVTIEVDAKWTKIVRSPIYFIVSCLTGASVSFAPVFLYWSGKGTFYPGHERIVLPLCFAVIYIGPLFYFRLGQAVVKELREKSKRDV
jgi:hypothetical protein